MTLLPTIRIATLIVLATLIQRGAATAAPQDISLMGSIEVISALSPIDQLMADATFTQSSPGAYDAARQQIHARLEALDFKPRWQHVADFETFTAWYSESRDLTVVCIEGTVPAGWIHRAYPEAGRITRNHYLLY